MKTISGDYLKSQLPEVAIAVYTNPKLTVVGRKMVPPKIVIP